MIDKYRKVTEHFAYAEPDLEFMKITKENYNEIAAKIPVLGNIQRHNRWCRDECAGSYRRSCHAGIDMVLLCKALI